MRPVQRARRAAVFLAVASSLFGCTPFADAPIPDGYDDTVESARDSLRGNLEGLIRPNLEFTGIRCFANGGVVVLFRLVGGARSGEPAFAMQGPGAVENIWSGGYGDVKAMNEEIASTSGASRR